MKGHSRPRRTGRRILLAISVAIWIMAFVATHIPGSAFPRPLPSDKLLHFVGYLVLGGLLLATAAAYDTRPARRAILVACALVLYASVDEFTQTFVNRNAALTDWIADVAGAITAVIVLEIIFALIARRRWKAMMKHRMHVTDFPVPSNDRHEGI